MNLRSVLQRLDDAFQAFDGLPVSPTRLGTALLDWDLDRREKIAMMDPVYAAEERARRRPDGSLVLSSPEENLTIEGWSEHEHLGDQLAPPGLLDKVARAARDTRLGRLSSGLLTVSDRAVRGWADRDVWNLNTSLAWRTGEQLCALADQAHSWPDSRYTTFEEWQAALRANGQALLAYARADGVDDLTDVWFDMPYGPDRDAARAAVTAREEELSKAAADAWRWVAEHHDHLWD